MDTSEMQELLTGYLNEMNWAGGATKDDVLRHLSGRDETLRTMINEYVAEGTYGSPADLLNVIPAQAWQDAQGDRWTGPTSLDPDDVDSGFQAGPVGQDDSDVYHSGQSAPPTPGFGQSTPEQGTATGGGAGAGGSTAAGDDAMGVASGAGSGTGQAGTGAAAMVDAVVVAVDVTGDGIPDAVIVDAVVVDDGTTGDSGGNSDASGR